MLVPTAVLLLASYVGPVASPDENLGGYPAVRSERRIEQNEAGYIHPRARQTERSMPREAVMPEAERAEEGRMVVPKAFR
ncbi:MAG: hypothetical protein P1U36_03930 [Legionellaceae bacterium]|nr:hypothetical protein [Legionellaceae bacterium]